MGNDNDKGTGKGTVPAQLYCAYRTASVAPRNAVRASVLIFDLGLPVPFAPVHFPIFEANSRFLTGTSCILLKFGVWGCPRLSYNKVKGNSEGRGRLGQSGDFLH